MPVSPGLSSHRHQIHLQTKQVLKMVTSPVTAFITVMALLTFSSALSETQTTQPQLNIGLECKRLISLTRKLTSQAKDGISLSLLKMNILNLQTSVSQLLGQIPDQISECQTQAVIKMAAAGIGSHEILGLLLAEDPIAVVSSRLSLCLAFLEHVTQQLEDELTLSRDVSPYLAAMVFGTNASVLIIQNSDEVVMEVAALKKQDGDLSGREEKPVRPMGDGFSIDDVAGVKWKSFQGKYTFYPRPIRVTRQASVNAGVGWSSSGGWSANVGVTVKF